MLKSILDEHSNKIPVGNKFVYTTAYGQKFVDVSDVKTYIHLKPPINFPPIDIIRPLTNVLSDLLAIDRDLYSISPARCFGLEARVAYYYSEILDCSPELNPRQHLIRPAPEPVVYSYWERFKSWTFDESSVSALASCLCGRDLRYRDAVAASLPNRHGVSVLYPEPAIATRWLSFMPPPPRGTEVLEGLAAAFAALASLILHHPLTDGNGRFGRALFQGVLARTVGLSAPMLALGPLISINRPAEIRAWVALGTQGDWGGLVETYHAALKGCLSYHRKEAEFL